jgi:hypothetical protein
MIKLFRKIRQRLITENKASKYLMYAIGEIVLVVVGILIALQINNWNINRVNWEESTKFNQRLLTEVDENILLIDNKIEKIKSMITSSRGILELINKAADDENLKTLDSLIYISIMGVNTKVRTGTLNEGLNTGKVALIVSDDLKSKLYGLPSVIENISDIDKTYSHFNDQILQPFLFKNFNFRTMDQRFSGYNLGESKFKSQHNKDLINNEQFENLIDNHFFQSNSQLAFHMDLKHQFENIKKLIEEELPNK